MSNFEFIIACVLIVGCFVVMCCKETYMIASMYRKEKSWKDSIKQAFKDFFQLN